VDLGADVLPGGPSKGMLESAEAPARLLSVVERPARGRARQSRFVLIV
jgi:hypothetical protein